MVWLTDTDGYVTSPGFDGMRGLYPPGYDGTFDLHLLDYQSVFIKFTHFDLEPEGEDGECYDDYLDFRVTAFNQAWRKCGQQDILSRVYRSSVTVSFHTDDLFQFTGFKMMYAILPRSQGPQELSDNLYSCSSTTFSLPVQLDSVVEDLPVVELTDTLGYVTSPGFNKSDGLYPNGYVGLFHLHLSDDQSVFTSFTHFVLETGDECRYDYLDLRLTALSQTWRKCGDQDIPPRVYRSSIHLFFHSDNSNQFTGFKMMYAILPRSQEPQQLSDSLYNCSVPHFHSFKPLLSCNMVTECQGNEDEEDCDHHSNECGDGAVDAGTYTCSGFYRCRRSKVCLHADHVCDGVFQCPQCYDEQLCERLPCPDVCHCQGLAFVCTANFPASSYPDLRYLDASGSGMRPSYLTYNLLLIHLRLSDCRFDTLPTLVDLPNLRHLDLSGNDLTDIDMQHFRSLKNLRVLVLSVTPCQR